MSNTYEFRVIKGITKNGETIPIDEVVNTLNRVNDLDAKVEELSKLIDHGNADALLGWMDAHAKVSDQRDELEARVKELEAELCKLKKSYDVVSAYAAHYTPDHKLEDKRKELNEAYE
jgi:hypothetical protein